MPRQARLDAPGALHQVMGRIEGISIFRSDEDREGFLRRLGVLCEGEILSVHAWALLDNHFHLLIRTGWQRISEGMRKLLTGYVVRGRKVFCQVAVRKLGYTGASAARFPGMTTPSVNRMARLEEMTELDAWDK